MRGGCFAFIPLQLSLRKCPVLPSSNCSSRTMRLLSTSQGGSQEQEMILRRQQDDDRLNTSSSTTASTGDNPSSSLDHPFLDPDNKFILTGKIAASRHGLPAEQNVFHQPIVHHKNYSFKNWPPKQTFPMTKFYHLAKVLTTKQTHLPRPLVRSYMDFYQPLNHTELPRAWFAQPHGPISPLFLDRFLSSSLNRDEERKIGFRECCKMEEVKERTVLEVGGTILAAQLAWKYGLATNAAGGTHHADSEMGAGYTILNDLAVTANFLMDEELNGGTVKGVNTVLVIDCDVHQGDGTAKFDKVLGDKLVTLSMHCDSNYPTYKARSTYDVPLPDKMGDDDYMEVLIESVERAIAETNPDFVLYDAGVDVHKDDFLGRLALTDQGIRRRDRWVIDKCVESKIPIVGVIGGGYDKDPIILAKRHAIVHEEAAFVWRKRKMWNLQ